MALRRSFARTRGGLGAKPPALLDSYKHYRNSPQAQQARPRPPFCGKATMWGTSEKGDHKFARHLCKSYRCPICGPKKRRRLRARLADLAQRHGLDKMLTLTIDPATLPAD